MELVFYDHMPFVTKITGIVTGGRKTTSCSLSVMYSFAKKDKEKNNYEVFLFLLFSFGKRFANLRKANKIIF